MARPVGRVFKISKNQSESYGYVTPRSGFKRNGGVTAIAAINGRGAYARSGRASMGGLSRNARVAKARRQLSSAERSAFANKMRLARNAKRGGSLKRNTRRAAGLAPNIGRMGRSKKYQRNAARKRPVGAMLSKHKRKTVAALKAAQYRSKRSPGTRSASSKESNMAKKRRKKSALGGTKRRRKSSKRRRKGVARAAAPKRRKRRRKAKAKSAAPKRRRRRRKARKTTLKANGRRRRRRRARLAANPRRRRRRKAKATGRRRVTRRRRKAGKRRTARRTTKRRSAARRGWATRRRRRGVAEGGGFADMSSNGRRRRRRRKLRRNSRKSYASNKRRKSGRRRHRRNGSRSVFRRNGAILGTLKMGAILGVGFVAHRVLTNLVNQQLISRLLPAPAPATAGFDVAKYAPSFASIGVAALGVFGVNALVKDQETKKLLIGGLAVSAVHGLLVNVLNAFAPQAANMLAGPQDGTAARIAAMYGLGNGASIMPRYAPINGMGEYFAANGVGEYFAANGVGEYFASGVNGLGSYGANPDMQYEAAAGVNGKVVEVSGTHIDPSSNLDRVIDIAEAAAGVGAVAPYEAAAGMGMAFEAAAGLGNVTVPRTSTWIPGTSDPSIWAGTVPINKGQAATEMVSAGMLATQGGQGIFG